ncbi:MAG: VTT domain-containing protein [Candidatus Micrarchaeota archaeon]
MLDLNAIITGLLQSFGYSALFAIVFAESGLFFGFFLPGDSLLFTAGLLASQGIFNLAIVLIGVALSAILGDQAGYWMGRKYGRGFFNKPGSLFRDPKHIVQAEEFYQKHGKKTIVLARFVPAVRTFAPIVAGIGEMEYKTFITYNIAGGILWTVLFVGLGFGLGKIIPNAGDYLTLLILAIIVLSFIPIGLEYMKSREKTPYQSK